MGGSASVFRVGQSQVLLELVLAFQRGETAEGIVRSYPALRLADVYSVIGRYLASPRPSMTTSPWTSRPKPSVAKSNFQESQGRTDGPRRARGLIA